MIAALVACLPRPRVRAPRRSRTPIVRGRGFRRGAPCGGSWATRRLSGCQPCRALITVISLLAALGPTRRGLAMQPSEVLREE